MKSYSKHTIKYYNKIAKKYIKSNAAIVREKELNMFIKMLPGKLIIDLACGPGHDTSYLTKKGFKCIGIDLSTEMIKLAKEKALGIFRVKDVFDLDYDKDSFDGVWCSSIFVHIDKNDIKQLIEDIKRILKQDGIIGIITAEKQKRMKNKEDIRKYTMYTRKELEDYLKRNGFEILISKTIYHGGYKGRKKRLFIIAQKLCKNIDYKR